MIKLIKIMLYNEEVGRLVWDEHRHLSYFTYNPEYIKKGLNISPFVAPINVYKGMLPIWGEDAKMYQKLPAFLADSLPDAWGNQLFDLWCKQNHIANSQINPLDKLSFIGKRGMGALEFIPEQNRDTKKDSINISSLTDLAIRIFKERENASIKPEESITMQSLLSVGTSAGGRQPKAIIAINKFTGEVRSGQISDLEDYDYFLLKFGDSEYSSAELEMTYYEMAVKAGIKMMPSKLYSVDGNSHFLTQRFDRVAGKKMHTQTLAAMYPDAESYEQLITVCRKLHLPEADCIEVFRRMVFNILSNNTDDHNKNFSFIMSEDGQWRLSPAYDITYIIDKGGFLPNEDHCMYIRAKLNKITRTDVLEFARDNGIRRPDSIIRDVIMALKEFRDLATKNGVLQSWIGRVETTITNNLKFWGENCGESVESEEEINGHIVKNISLSQTYKGNYHLLANIDGVDKKFVIGKNKEEYLEIEQQGLTNLTSDFLKNLAIKYFKL